MAERSFLVRGTAVTVGAPPKIESGKVTVTPVRRLLPGRARDGASAEVEVKADDIVRVELDNGFVLYSRADDLIDEQGTLPAARGGAEPAWEISEFSSVRAALAPSRGDRGVLGLGIKVLDFFGVDLGGMAADALAARYERRQLAGDPGLYRCSLEDDFDLSRVADGEALPSGDGPLLLFIHGTGSSCAGGFGGLWKQTNAEGRSARKQLKARYQERVFAFEHYSFTTSPVANALDLVRRLPPGAEVHLVTHSRGGLIGELLALSGCADLAAVLTPERLDELFGADRTMAEQLGLSPLHDDERKARDASYEADRELLAELVAELVKKKLQVGRFVRVACPARGTTLASGRLDRWLSVLSFVAERVDQVGLFGDGLDFLLAVVKKRTDPRTLPGIEAMMPGSALTRLLHHPDLKTAADLSVIAGDVEGDSLWQRLKFVVADWFYGADHDLVVNTGSMTGGIARIGHAARFHLDRGADVTHSSYFLNARSVRWLVAGLTRADHEQAGYLPIAAAPQDEPRWRGAVARSRATTEPRPLAVVLPGTMGTHLEANGRHIWLKYLALLRGGLKHLRIDQSDVVALELIDAFYGPLLEFLARSHHVEIFGYDWRRSVRDAAEHLAEKLEEWLLRAERENQPVHIVAHSMGGLVVRAMLGDPRRGANLWQRITRLPNSRFLMLGTPNYGSYEAVRWLTGMNPTQAKLALLDLTQSEIDLANLVATYPGLLELLPFGALLDMQSSTQDKRDFTDRAHWERLKHQTKAEWTPATDKALRDARTTWQRLEAAPVDKRHMCYVAGAQPVTVIDYELTSYRRPAPDGRKRLEFLATEDGDGTVPWVSGALPGLPTWYATDTAHDALCATKQWFPAYLDLLATGTTRRLPDAPPRRRRGGLDEPKVFPLPQSPPADSIPGDNDLRVFGLGGEWSPPLDDTRPPTPMIDVSIRHGNLAYVRHPVLVGHYEGDTIVSAEAFLDGKLGNALSRRLALGVYPGPPNTHAVFFQEDRDAKPAGAVVVGLGQVGVLTAGLLESGARAALLEYALQVAQWPDDRFGKPGAPRSAAVSCVLVGSGAGQLPLRASIESLLRGAVAANARLAATGMDNRVLIDKIEFVELYEDVALSACAALQAILNGGTLTDFVRWPAQVVDVGQGGQRRSRFDEAPGWWQRLEIFRDENRADILRFVFASDRARAEETLALGQLSLAESFVRRASASSTANQEISQTLFEMLLPLRLKENAPRQSNLVVMVDKASARYPWELLENRWSDNGRPPAVAAGFVRQLKTSEFRAQPAHAVKATALVVGHPDLEGWRKFADLPGARREAGKVVEVLGARSYDVTESIDEKSEDILAALHRAPWRIVHFAGHGVHEELVEAPPTGGGADTKVETKPRRVSGMVIGKETFLTPGDIAQMRWVPELVFINCCHLGRTEAEHTVDRVGLAANLGIEFIHMGVRAVVAAGWAVEDNAALVFAETFYRWMLDGATFGEAVRAARDETWRRFRGVNTWGAYQCYGDQSYRLRPDGRNHAAARPAYATPTELVVDFDNVAAQVRVSSGGAQDLQSTRAKIDDLLGAIPAPQRDRWLGRADVCAAVGFAYGDLRDWRSAIEWLDKAIAAEQGVCPIKAVEQCANFKSRRAAEEWLTLREQLAGQALERARAEHRDVIEAAIMELDLLKKRGATAERLNLLGSACKRLAIVQSADAPRREALLNMGKYYSLAYAKDKASVYSFTNWATAHLLAVRWGAQLPRDWETSLSAGLAQLTDLLETRYAEEPSFWDGAGLGDLQLVQLLDLCLNPRSGAPKPPPGARKKKTQARSAPGGSWPTDGDARIAEARRCYLMVIRRGASPREVSSVVENLDFVIEMLGGAALRVGAELTALRGSLS